MTSDVPEVMRWWCRDEKTGNTRQGKGITAEKTLLDYPRQN
jgi:hypothetical protein